MTGTSAPRRLAVDRGALLKAVATILATAIAAAVSVYLVMHQETVAFQADIRATQAVVARHDILIDQAVGAQTVTLDAIELLRRRVAELEASLREHKAMSARRAHPDGRSTTGPGRADPPSG